MRWIFRLRELDLFFRERIEVIWPNQNRDNAGAVPTLSYAWTILVRIYFYDQRTTDEKRIQHFILHMAIINI